MVLQRFFVVGLLDIFEDLGDDGRIAIGIQINFLVVGNLADLTVTSLVTSANKDVAGHAGMFTNLVSAKLEGRSTVIAPPKNSVFVNAIFVKCVLEERSRC
jgi:hypothetical protein